MLCPKCKKPIDSFTRYFIYENKVIEVCKSCYRKLQVHRMNVKVKGKTIVIDQGAKGFDTFLRVLTYVNQKCRLGFDSRRLHHCWHSSHWESNRLVSGRLSVQFRLSAPFESIVLMAARQSPELKVWVQILLDSPKSTYARFSDQLALVYYI